MYCHMYIYMYIYSIYIDIHIYIYIDTGRTYDRTLDHIRITAALANLVKFLIVCRHDRKGDTRKGAVIREFLDQTNFTECSLFLIDETCKVILKIHRELHVKLKPKPHTGPSIPTAAFLADGSPIVEEWLQA